MTEPYLLTQWSGAYPKSRATYSSLARKYLSEVDVTNALAYSVVTLSANVKSFIVQAF